MEKASQEKEKITLEITKLMEENEKLKIQFCEEMGNLRKENEEKIKEIKERFEEEKEIKRNEMERNVNLEEQNKKVYIFK